MVAGRQYRLVQVNQSCWEARKVGMLSRRMLGVGRVGRWLVGSV